MLVEYRLESLNEGEMVWRKRREMFSSAVMAEKGVGKLIPLVISHFNFLNSSASHLHLSYAGQFRMERKTEFVFPSPSSFPPRPGTAVYLFSFPRALSSAGPSSSDLDIGPSCASSISSHDATSHFLVQVATAVFCLPSHVDSTASPYPSPPHHHDPLLLSSPSRNSSYSFPISHHPFFFLVLVFVFFDSPPTRLSIKEFHVGRKRNSSSTNGADEKDNDDEGNEIPSLTSSGRHQIQMDPISKIESTPASETTITRLHPPKSVTTSTPACTSAVSRHPTTEGKGWKYTQTPPARPLSACNPSASSGSNWKNAFTTGSLQIHINAWFLGCMLLTLCCHLIRPVSTSLSRCDLAGCDN